MARIESEPIDRDERLGEAIEAYLAEAEGGSAPDPDEFAARYPDLSDELREALEGLALVRGLVGESSGLGRTLEAGRRVAGYRIVRELGRGGMGVVYEAVHVDLDRPVALKVLGTQAAPDSTGRRRFLNEAKTAAGLHHTHIVPVFDVGQVGGLCYYAMQRIEGCGLDRVLRALRRDRSIAAGSGSHRPSVAPSAPPTADEPGLSSIGSGTITWTSGSRRSGRHRLEDEAPAFEPPRGSAYYRWVAQVGRQAAEALAHAHRRGVIHRDIKPSNLLVDARGSVWVADFGLARRLADPALTQTDSLLGTPRYMSPEQAKAGPIDGRTDVYSLGATLYELLTLRPPFEGKTAAELVQQISDREPPLPRKTDPRIPRDLETIVLKAMAKRPTDRYASAQELAEDLNRFLAFEPVKARRVGPLGRTLRFAQRHRLLSVVSTTAAIAIVAVATWAHLSVVAQYNKLLKAQEETETALEKAQQANRRSEAARRQQLWREASVIRLSTMPNRRKEGLNRLREASLLGPEPELKTKLRNEAVEFLAMRDIEARPEIPTGKTWGLVFPDQGERLATIADDGSELIYWDVARGEPELRQGLRTSPVDSVPMVPALRFPPRDGPRIGSGIASIGNLLAVIWPNGQGIRLFMASTGARFADMEMSGHLIDAILASSDGRRLVTLERVREPQLPGLRGPRRQPDGLRIALWDPSRLDRPIATLDEPIADRASRSFQFPLVTLSPDGETIAVASLFGNATEAGSTITLWNASDGSLRDTIENIPAALSALAMGPDGLLAAAAGDGTIRLWDVNSLNPLPGLYHHQNYVRALRFSPDGTLLAVAGAGSGIELWDPASNTLVATVRTGDRVHDLAFSPDGRTLAASAGGRTSIWAIVEPVGRTRLAGFDSRPTSLAFGPDGLLAIASWNAPPRLWQPGHCPTTARSWFGVQSTTLAFDNQGRLVAGDPDGLEWFQSAEPIPVAQITLPGGRRGSSIAHLPVLAGAAVVGQTLNLEPRGGRRNAFWMPMAHADNGRILALVRSHEVFLWRGDDPNRIQYVRPPTRSRFAEDDDARRFRPPPWVGLAVSPTGDRLYLLSFEGDLHVWALGGARARELSWPIHSEIRCLSLSNDGQTLALGNRKGQVVLIDTADGTVQSTIVPEGEAVEVSSLAFAPDGRTLAIGFQNGSIGLWALDGRQTERLVSLPGHVGSVYALTFEPAGHHLASAGDDKVVQVWDLDQIRLRLGALGLGW